MRNLVIRLVMSTFAVAVLAPIAWAQDGAGDWTITSDTTVDGRVVDVAGDLIVKSGATLTILGSEVRIADRVLVEKGGSLHLGPSGNRGAVLGPLDGVNGFWMEIRGVLVTSGSPGATIAGLRGNGLESAVGLDGGLVVHGDADLSGSTVRDGTGPITVAEPGVLRGENLSVRNLGEIGIAVLGKLNASHLSVSEVDLAVTGRKTCDIVLLEANLQGRTNQVVVNSCRFSVESSQLVGGGTPVVATGNAVGTLARTVLVAYRTDGLAANMHPGPNGLLKPNVTLQAVTFSPLPSAQSGITTLGGTVHAQNCIIIGHAGDGVNAKEAVLDISGSTIMANKGYGINAVAGVMRGDPAASNEFGDPGGSHRNVAGEVAHTVAYKAVATSAGKPVAGVGILVRDAAGQTVFDDHAHGEYLIVSYEAYQQDADGRSLLRGPFSYVATHDRLQEPVEGSAPEFGLLQIPVPKEQGPGLWTYGAMAVFGIGALLVMYGIAGKRIKGLLRKRKS